MISTDDKQQLLIGESAAIRYSNAKKQLQNNNGKRTTNRLVKILQTILIILVSAICIFGIIQIANSFAFVDNFDEIENCCANIESAKNCNSIDYCIGVWKSTEVVDRSEPEICKECIRMVEMARDQLDSNMTREELAEVFRGVCKIYFLNIKPLVKQCDKLVDKYLDEYLEMLISAMDPETICRTALLCPNEYDFTGGCSMCRQYSNRSLIAIDSKSSHENLQNFDKFLMKTCSAIIRNRTICSAIRTANINVQIFENIRDGLRTNAFCDMGSLCYLNNHQHSQFDDYFDRSGLALHELDDRSQTCQSCCIVVDAVRQSLVRETSRLEFRSIAEKVCVHFATGEQLVFCKRYLQSNLADQIFFALNQPDFAQRFCRDSQQCKRKREIDFGDSIDETGPIHHLPIERILLVRDEPIRTRHSLETLPRFASDDDNNNKDCIICLLFIESIRNYLEQNKTIDEIYHYMQNVCKTFDLQLQADCVTFVSQYGKRITTKFFQDIHPDKICLDFDFCA